MNACKSFDQAGKASDNDRSFGICSIASIPEPGVVTFTLHQRYSEIKSAASEYKAQMTRGILIAQSDPHMVASSIYEKKF
jgi:hypothetical protein